MMTKARNTRIAPLLFAAFFLAAGASAATRGRSADLPRGKGKIIFADPELNGGRPLDVFTYVPSRSDRRSPILFVMHGNSRNGDEYRDQWTDIAEKRSAVLVCPNFSSADFPRDTQYNMGNMFVMDEEERMGAPLPKSDWTFSLIEPIFDMVRKAVGSDAEGYLLYGHSAGSQFVHRFLFFVPEARVLKAVCANAGWYTFPDAGVPFPYGLKGTGAGPERLKTVFAKNVTVLLGEADVDPNASALRKTPEAEAQGPYRLARGRSFYASCEKAAGALGFDFRWRLSFAPGIAHSNSGMAPFAEKILFERP